MFNLLFSPYRPRFSTVRQFFDFQFSRLTLIPRYNSFVIYLYGDALSTPVLPF